MCSVSRHFFNPFSVYDGGLSLLETVRNPANAYESRSESIFHLAIIDYFSGLKEPVYDICRLKIADCK